MKFFKLKEEVVFFYTKRVAGIIVLQKLWKALVHSGDVIMNIVSLWWERGDCIQVIVFLKGHVAQAARRLARGSTARIRSRVSEGEGRFFFTPSYPDCSLGPLSLL